MSSHRRPAYPAVSRGANEGTIAQPETTRDARGPRMTQSPGDRRPSICARTFAAQKSKARATPNAMKPMTEAVRQMKNPVSKSTAAAASKPTATA